MILTCPECATRYQAKEAAFQPSGRRVRCAKCGHTWHQDPPPTEEPAEEEAIAVAPAPEPARREAFVPRRPEVEEEDEEEAEPVAARRGGPIAGRIAVGFGWIALVLVVLVIGWAAVNFREEVATLWPQSASLYSALGMKVNARGVAISEVKYTREKQDGQSVFAVTGKLVNVSSHDVSVPRMRVTLSGSNGQMLYEWEFMPAISNLRVGQSANFLTRLSSPPAGVRQLTVQFADAKG
jgi:predicted Zn finger-like uncharacterized protein